MALGLGRIAQTFKKALAERNAGNADTDKRPSPRELEKHRLPEPVAIDYPDGDKVNDEPAVYVFESYLSQAEVHQIIKAASNKMQRAKVSADKAGVESAGRTGSNCWVPHKHNKIIHGLAKRISKLVGIPLRNAESYQVIHYGESQQYAAHYDGWVHGSERGDRCMARGGQRLVTCLIYLNDVPAGGGTGFPKLDLEVQAKKGRMVVFHNCYPGTNLRHPKSLHGGLPVEQGDKWAVNLWFREGDYWQTPSASKKV